MTANSLQTSDLLIEKVLFQLRMMNTLLAPGVANNEYEQYFNVKKTGFFSGNSVRIRKPNFYDTQRAWSVTPTGVIEEYATITLGLPISIPLQFTSGEAATKISFEGEGWAERVMAPVANSIMATFNGIVSTEMETQVYNYVGDASAEITAVDNIFTGRGILSELGASVGMMYEGYCALHPQVYQSLSPQILKTFLPVQNQEIYTHGTLGNIAGFDTFIEPQMKIHRGYPGGSIGTVKVRTNMVSGDTVVKLKGLTPSITNIFTAGDLFQITGAGGNPTPMKLNLVTHDSTGRKFQFVVTANTSSDSSGYADVPVLPVLISDPTNPRRNISGIFHADDTVQVVGDYVCNMMWLKPTLTIVAPPLPLLNKGAESWNQADPETGITVCRSVQDNVMLRAHGHRIDVWPGVYMDGLLACKIISKAPALT